MNEEEFKEKISNQNFHYFKEDKELLKKFTSFLPKDSSIGERRYYFLHNITEIQKCPVCGKKVEYDGRKNRIKVFCSVECYRSAEGNKLTYDKVDEKKKNRFKIRRLTKKEIRQNLKRMRKEYNEKIMANFYSNLSEEKAKQFLREKINNCGFIWKLKISDIEKGLLKLFTSFLPENSTLAERKFYFENNLNEIQKCIVCGKPISFIKNKSLRNFCSEKCRVSEKGKASTGKKISKSLKEKEYHFKKEDLIGCEVEITDDNRKQLREILKNKIILFGKRWDKRITKEDYFLLFEFTSFLPNNTSVSERRWYFINDLNEIQKCPICGKKLRFLKEKRKLSEFCSDKCRKSNEGRNRILFIQRNNHFKSFMISLHKRNLKPLFTINEYANAIMDKELKFKCDVCGCEFNYIVEKHNRINLYNILCPKCFKKTVSSGEKEIAEWLKSIGIENIERNKRDWNIKAKQKLEADIFLPDYNLAIEYNGIYWHSNLFKKSNYHLKKYNFFKKLKIDCIQIFENEWILKKDIVKDVILKKLNKIENRINANDCSLRELNDEEYKSFVEQNYIKGYAEVDIAIGLFYNNELVQCLGMKKENIGWIIICDCSKLNWVVENGTEKLLNGFKGSIIVKLDKRFCDNIHNNFKFKESLKPKCYYFKNNNLTFLDKIDVLSKKELSKYIKIYDCGYDVYILENH